MKKLLVLDNYDSFTYNLVHYIEASGEFHVDVFRNDEITIEAVDQYDMIVLSPGPGLPKDAGILKELIKKYASSKKILGVCLGMQAIGEVYGGELVNLDEVFHGVSSTINVIDASDLLYQNLPAQIEVGRYHSWVISQENFPKELNITAIEDNNQIMSLKHKDYDLYGVQYHPESILTENGKTIISNFLSLA
jgi:anthranilate synthase component 2